MDIGKNSACDIRVLEPRNGMSMIPHGHAVHFYKDDEIFLNSLSQWVGAALGIGDAVVVIATKQHTKGLTRRLQGQGLDSAAAIKRGNYVLLDASETLSKIMKDGWPQSNRLAEIMGKTIGLARAAAKGEKPGIFAFGEMVALLWAEGMANAAIRLEQIWNELAVTHSFTFRCAYPIKKFDREEDGELFQKICAEHSEIIPDESYTALGSEVQRLRNVSFLQQQVQVLDREKAQRREIENILRQRDAELAELLENPTGGVQQTGPDQRILWAKNAVLRLLGYRPEEYLGHPLSEFFVREDTLNEYWNKLMLGEEIFDFPAEFRCKDGSVKHVLIHANGLWKDGQLIRTRSFIRDVTERHEMIQALKRAHDELEIQVGERTAELSQKNFQLQEQAKIIEMANKNLREMSVRLLQVQDDERRRISRDLQDGTGQALALLSMKLSRLEKEADQFSPKLARTLAENVQTVRDFLNIWTSRNFADPAKFSSRFE